MRKEFNALLLFYFFLSCNNRQDARVTSVTSECCVTTNIIAIEKAEKKWLEIYGNSINNNKPFTARLKYDSIWIVEGTLPKDVDGGVPYAEINARNGEFIKVTHSK